MKSLNMIVRNFVNDECGQDLIEYALVAAVISLGAVAALQPLATEVGVIFTSITGALTAAA